MPLIKFYVISLGGGFYYIHFQSYKIQKYNFINRAKVSKANNTVWVIESHVIDKL